MPAASSHGPPRRVRPADEHATANNLLAYDIRTGDLVASFAPGPQRPGAGDRPSPDGSRVYVAGEFTKANGVNRYRIAAYSTSTGALVTTWAPRSTSRPRARRHRLGGYVGGAFSTANGVARTRLAAFNPSNGALLSWAHDGRRPGHGDDPDARTDRDRRRAASSPSSTAATPTAWVPSTSRPGR
jgi:hypothetical protein